MLDGTVQPILQSSDHNPEFQVAYAPGFLYVNGTTTFTYPTFQQFAGYAAYLVRYYNKRLRADVQHAGSGDAGCGSDDQGCGDGAERLRESGTTVRSDICAGRD